MHKGHFTMCLNVLFLLVLFLYDANRGRLLDHRPSLIEDLPHSCDGVPRTQNSHCHPCNCPSQASMMLRKQRRVYHSKFMKISKFQKSKTSIRTQVWIASSIRIASSFELKVLNTKHLLRSSMRIALRFDAYISLEVFEDKFFYFESK